MHYINDSKINVRSLEFHVATETGNKMSINEHSGQ